MNGISWSPLGRFATLALLKMKSYAPTDGQNGGITVHARQTLHHMGHTFRPLVDKTH